MPKHRAFAGLFMNLLYSVPAEDIKPRFLSVMEFGAKGNWNYADRTGIDDTEAIQRAIDHAATASSKSSTVYFPPGNYRVSSTIRLPNGFDYTIRDERSGNHRKGILADVVVPGKQANISSERRQVQP
ncbi:MAG: hypothetical protein JSV03_17555 [Planctomycetota bacterium]|nr:MAG: hypothetical protein JSV03_17555 [Planctomycetota bacterium]